MSDHLDALDRVIDEVVAPSARRVDQEGVFPAQAVAALGSAGLLGLTSSAEVGGGGQGMEAAAVVVERLAGACGSTSMVVLMHYAATSLVESAGSAEHRQAIASGGHLSTLAFSESGSRSHFWAPMSTAVAAGDKVVLDASKSWVTSAGHADSYVWSSRPVSAEGPMTLWAVPTSTKGVTVAGPFDGLGLRGNASLPVTAKGSRIPATAMIGADGAGLDLALAAALPWFLVLSGAFSLGLMEAVTSETGTHLGSTRLEHLDQTLIQQPLARQEYARMRLTTDSVRALLGDTLAALGAGRPDAMLRVLEIKAFAAEAAIEVTDRAMKVCGGSAFRKELGIERRFRDARAARVMAPTTDALLDFVGRAISGLPLLGPA